MAKVQCKPSHGYRSGTVRDDLATFSGKGHVKRNKRVSNVLPQPEGHLKIFMTAFCGLNRSNPWRRFADTPEASATCGGTSRAKYSSIRSASGTLSVSRSSGSGSGWPSLSRQMMAASSRSERAERMAFCAEAGNFRPACNVLAGRGGVTAQARVYLPCAIATTDAVPTAGLLLPSGWLRYACFAATREAAAGRSSAGRR
jgi:hypothetical protein